MDFPTAESFYGARSPGAAAHVPVAGLASRLVSPNAPLPKGKAISKPVLRVEVNGGRWVVRCPFCNSAQHASHTDPRFMCVPAPHGCSNESVGGKWLKVQWPKNPELIEAALSPRPMPNRNWKPGESIDYLLAENAAHGVA